MTGMSVTAFHQRAAAPHLRQLDCNGHLTARLRHDDRRLARDLRACGPWLHRDASLQTTGNR